MGQFKPMVKMMTTEPSVELKLKKGGHVNMKKGGHAKQEKDTGHKSMSKMMDGGVMGALASTPALVGRPAVNAPVRAPARPPMAMRRKAMAPRPMMKEGGKADEAKDKAMVKKAFKMHDKQEHKGEHTDLSKLKRGGKMKKYASGGEVDSAQTKTTVKGNAGMYAQTLMHGTPKGKTNGTTGAVKEGNAGGYKRGGSVSDETTSGNPTTTIMHEAKRGREHGPTGGVKEEQGGYKSGGSARKYAGGGNVSRYVTNNVVGTPAGVTNKTTGGVREGNAGGYKKGGSSKKAYATGGIVDSGRPVAMPQGRKPASKPVSNDKQSGTFKRGGKVGRYGDGGATGDPIIDRENRRMEAERASEKAENERMRESILGAPRRMMEGIKGLFSSQPPSGSVTKTEKSVTVTPSKKRGGKC